MNKEGNSFSYSKFCFHKNAVLEFTNTETFFYVFFSYFQSLRITAYTELSSILHIYVAKLFPQIYWRKKEFWKLPIAKVDSNYNTYSNRFTALTRTFRVVISDFSTILRK